MPCDASYMEPTALETESVRVAKILRFVYMNMKTEPPEELPFTMDMLTKGSQGLYGLPLELLDPMVKELCFLRKHFTKEQEDAILYNGRDPISRDFAAWWEEHEKADKVRLYDNVRKIKECQLQIHNLYGQINDLKSEIKRLENDL